MIVDVVLLPVELRPAHLQNRAVAVFDVLRATTTMTAALAVGVSEIRLFGDVASARTAAGADGCDLASRLLIGEERCLPPEGFDLGNSPGHLRHRDHADRIAFMCTTNGTRALIAARGAAVRFAGSVVNASAVARALVATDRPITLLCAGTGGNIAMEDVIGCGAVIAAMQWAGVDLELASDTARIARRLFADNRHRLREVMAETDGGQNVIAAGLPGDIDFSARLDVFNVVGVVEGDDPIVRRRQNGH